ncbi:MAG: carboxymuconolactone decarboxylase family protein [Pseudomonadota bacterium]
MKDTASLRYEQLVPDVIDALARAQGVVDVHAFDPKIHNLVRLRASQLNRCGFCVKMHLGEAREAGETQQRLDRLVVWDQVRDFSAREQAALAWTEALTALGRRADIAGLRDRMRGQFSDAEIGLVTANIAMINMWNRINVSTH